MLSEIKLVVSLNLPVGKWPVSEKTVIPRSQVAAPPWDLDVAQPCSPVRGKELHVLGATAASGAEQGDPGEETCGFPEEHWLIGVWGRTENTGSCLSFLSFIYLFIYLFI